MATRRIARDDGRVPPHKTFNDFHCEPANDLDLFGGITEGVPDIHQARCGHASEEAVVLDNGNCRAQARRPHGGEHARTASADNAQIALVHNRDIARAFLKDAGHARYFPTSEGAST